jgi:hypothetical protein
LIELRLLRDLHFLASGDPAQNLRPLLRQFLNARGFHVAPGWRLRRAAGHGRGRNSEVARAAAISESPGMATITIQVEDDLARQMEESARRAHQTVAEWITARIKPAPDDNEPVASETHLGLEDFPRFAETKLKPDQLSRDIIYDERGR